MESKYDGLEPRTEEDKIIEIIIVEGKNALYEDYDFIPNSQSLYEVNGFVPAYDEQQNAHLMWRRPQEISNNPEYMSESAKYPIAVQGRYVWPTLLELLLISAFYSLSSN